MSAEENRTFPILDAITETLRGRGLSSRRIAPTIVTSSLVVGSRAGVLTPSEIRSSTSFNQNGVDSNSSTRPTTGGKSTSSDESSARTTSRRDRPSGSVVKATANGSTAMPPAVGCDGRRTCNGTRGSIVSLPKTPIETGSCSECCSHSLHHGLRRHDGRLLQGQRHHRSSVACSGECCCPLRESDGYGSGQNGVTSGLSRRSRRRLMEGAPLNGTGNGPCCCNANGDCCCCAVGDDIGCCGADRLHYADVQHANGAMVTGCRHGNVSGRSSRDCYGNGRQMNGHAPYGYDEDHLTWDEVDLDGGGLLDDECLMAAGDDVEDDGEHSSAVDGRYDVARSSTMYDMSAIPWDMMSKWCRYTALANLLPLW